MAELGNKEARTPLTDALVEANKRAEALFNATRALSEKLFGARPQETTAPMPELSVIGLAHRLNSRLAELEDELGRQHNGVGELNAPPVQQQGRAVGY